MPIYDYACDSCEERFEELSRFDAPPPACPDCGSMETQRLLSTFLQLNAGGGYRNYMRSLPSLPGCGGGACGTHNH